MVGVWQYPVNPEKEIPHYSSKNQFRMGADDIQTMVKYRVTGDDVRVPEDIALKLAKASPNPAKAQHNVLLLASQGQLRLLPLAALLFSSARR